MKHINLKLSVLLIIAAASILSSCTTYSIVSSTSAMDLYTDPNATVVGFSIPVGSALLMKPSNIYGYVRVRYHERSTWYYAPTTSLAVVPMYDPQSYATTYTYIESDLAEQKNAALAPSDASASVSPATGYDAMIQTGPRGGKYYINKNGKKTYVKRSTPSGSTKHVSGTGRH